MINDTRIDKPRPIAENNKGYRIGLGAFSNSVK